MPRLILDLGAGAQTSAVRTAALNLASVQDAVEARQAGAVIVTVPEDRLTPATRSELANLPTVEGVFEDIQALPQVADPSEVEDFLTRVREARDDAPPVIETEPTRPDDELRSDGGATTLPAPQGERPAPAEVGPIQNATDSLEFAGVPAVHNQGVRGESIISVIVDTGSCGESIRDDRQLAGLDLTDGDAPWRPFADHGGMATGIMAGDESTPGIRTGFLPDSQVFPIKTTLAASELIRAQDAIVQLAEDNPDKTVVVNNSWGFQECEGLCSHPVTNAIQSAADHPRVIQVCAAGNQAAGITGCGQQCDGSTVGISGPNSLPNVITVAASGHNGDPTMIQPYSSRGGSGSVSCGRAKPDVAAPIFGTVPYGCGRRDLGNGGGTSGACPQASGAVGLLVDKTDASTAAAAGGLMQTAEQFRGRGWNGCSGAGNVQVNEAVTRGPVAAPHPGKGGETFAVATVGLTAGVIGVAAVKWARRSQR